MTSHQGLPTGSAYPTRDEDGNLLTTEFGLCVYKNHQTVTIQVSAPASLLHPPCICSHSSRHACSFASRLPVKAKSRLPAHPATSCNMQERHRSA